jgi:hypothetical protein
MQRLCLAAGALLAACLAGCSMCQAPDDYTGPAMGPSGAPTAGFYDRHGSVLAGSAPMTSYGPTVALSEAAPGPARATQPTPAAPAEPSSSDRSASRARP